MECFKMTTYNHAFTIAFAVPASKDKEGNDITAEQFRAAIMKHVDALVATGQLESAIGAPFDSFEEEVMG